MFCTQTPGNSLIQWDGRAFFVSQTMPQLSNEIVCYLLNLMLFLQAENHQTMHVIYFTKNFTTHVSSFQILLSTQTKTQSAVVLLLPLPTNFKCTQLTFCPLLLCDIQTLPPSIHTLNASSIMSVGCAIMLASFDPHQQKSVQ